MIYFYHTPLLTMVDNGDSVTDMSCPDCEILTRRVAALEEQVRGLAAHSGHTMVLDTTATASPPAKRTRGTRLIEGWTPAPATIEKMRAEYPWITSDQFTTEHRKFSDYWLAKAGANAVKLDWERTWCNWIRSAAEKLPRPRGEPTQGRPLSTVDQKVVDMQSKKRG